MECKSLGHISILVFLSVDLVTVVVPCSSYIANGNVWFRPYPGDCSKFVQCHQGISGVKGAIRQCPFGLFWHHDVISCHRSENVNCPEVPCSSYIANGNVWFRPYPGDCSKFVQCHQDISGVKVAIRQCHLGQFWHHDVISCHPSGNVNCPEDPCLLSSDGFTYGMNGFSCRSYWLCRNGRSIGACCDEGTYYLESVGCVIGQVCDTPCPPNVGFVGTRVGNTRRTIRVGISDFYRHFHGRTHEIMNNLCM